MVEGALFDIAKEIIRRAGNLAFQEIVLIWGVKDEINKLKETVSTISAVLLDAEAKQGNPQVRLWLKGLMDAILDADDLLDEISTEALRRDRKAKEVRIFFSKSNPLAYGHKMGQNFKAIRERLVTAAADRRFYLEERSEDVRDKSREQSQQTRSFIHAEDLIGREDDKKAIIESLLNPNVKENVSVLPIVGVGGVGKTALAQLVFNDEVIKNHFQLKLWVCVSDDFDVKIIVEKILECIKNEKRKDLEMNTLVNNLQEEINGKRYLLVLDDVWNESIEKWFSLKEILTGGKRGSGILLTTREKKVAQITKSMQFHLLKCLDDQQSWSLLKKMAFKEREELKNASFEKIGNEILKKCGGIPLAIRAIGGLLYFKRFEKEWLLFKNNEFLKISEEDNCILPILKLSYDNLPSHLKQCFAFCSLFPKDYKIEKASLIYMWIAQGFINLYKEKKCPEDVGDEYFMDLLCRSFFQEVEEDELGNISKFKIHDFMYDLAMMVMGSVSTIIYSKEKDIDEEIRHVSFGHILSSSSEIPISLYKARRIRTFILPCQPKYGNINSDHSTCSEIIASFKYIRLLDLRNMEIKTIPSSIKKLKHLRYLDLSENGDIEMLPNSIVKLYNLQTLKLSRCYHLKELPRDINKLVSLRFLEIGGCSGLTHMPNGLGQLTNLVQFKLCYCEKCQYLPPLDQLPSLKIIYLISLDFLEHISDSERDNDNFLFYPSLEKLKIWGCRNLKGWWRGRRDSLPSFPCLSVLEITDSPQLTSFPLFPYLERLRLSNCSLKQSLERMMINNKTSLGNLPSIASSSSSTIVAPLSKLSFMHIENTEGALPKECLPNLISLCILNLHKCPLPQGMRYLTALQHLQVWDSEVVDLSNDWDEMEWQGLMTLLSLGFCVLPKLVSLPTGLQHISSLQKLLIKNCPNLESLPEWICKLISLQSLEISDCPNLKSLPEGISALTSLQTLDISWCPILLKRCKKQIGEDWHKISHIPNLYLSWQEEESDEEEPNEEILDEEEPNEEA